MATKKLVGVEIEENKVGDYVIPEAVSGQDMDGRYNVFYPRLAYNIFQGDNVAFQHEGRTVQGIALAYKDDHFLVEAGLEFGDDDSIVHYEVYKVGLEKVEHDYSELDQN